MAGVHEPLSSIDGQAESQGVNDLPFENRAEAEPGSEGRRAPLKNGSPHMQTQEVKMWPQALRQGRTFSPAKYSDLNWRTASAQGTSLTGAF